MISVVIPTYNRARYLKKALQSLAEQNIDSNSFEVVVVDDGSGDGTEKISKGFSDSLDVKYVYQDHSGVSVARNKGIDESAAEIIAFFDDDALAATDWVESIEKAMKGENVITGRVEPIKNNIWKYFAPHYNQGDSPKESKVLLEGNSAIKKNVFKTIGKFDEGLTYGHEGKEFISRASKKYKIMYYPNVVIRHDYAFGIVNYLKKQFKFGHKMSYLKNIEIKNLYHLIFGYRKIKAEDGSDASDYKKLKPNFFKKVLIYKIAKLGSIFHFIGAIAGYLKYKKTRQ